MTFSTRIVPTVYRYYRYFLKGITVIVNGKKAIQIEMDFDNPSGGIILDFPQRS